jgi:hypothetical protein
VAAVAWLAELFAQPEQREKVIGYTQAFASVGGLWVAFANGFAISHSAALPVIALPDWLNFFGGSIKDPHAAWRYTLMSGLIPALPLIVIRPFLPESPIWQKKRAEGTLKRPSIFELFSPEFARTTIITTIIFACSYGAAFGSIQQIQRIVPGLPEVKEQVKGKPVPVQKKIEQAAATSVTKVQEVGGLVGRFVLAVLVVRVVSWQRLLRIFQTPGLILMPLVFGVAAVTNMKFLSIGMFFVGLVTVAQFSFWGNYLPHVYPMHLRGTGESFAANIGGRMIGTCFAWVTSELAVQSFIPGGSAETKLAYVAAAIGFLVYAVGLIASRWLPEPKASALPE